MQAIILAAGKGTRLKNLTKNIPKALINVSGKTLLEYCLDFLNKNQVKRIVIVVGYKSNLIEEFINIRKESGGDIHRKCLNLHNGINISNAFLEAVKLDDDWRLVDPKTNKAVKTIKARDLWWQILNVRAETGEPYMINIDTCNEHLPKGQKDLGLEIKQSNLCSENITY